MQKFNLFLILIITLFLACNDGERLSPIDLTEKSSNDSLMPLYNDYLIVDSFQMTNTGKYLRIAVNDCFLVLPDDTYDGKELKLKEIQIKSPSEHKINDKHFPLELQFIHIDTTNKTVIVSVMVEKGDENPDLNPIIENIPSKNEVKTITSSLDVYMLFPYSPNYWNYIGTTTLKPYSPVNWYVMKEPVFASDEQINKIIEAIGLNKVEVVETGDRLINEL